MTFEANVLGKAREWMSEFRSLTCHVPMDEVHRSFQEFVLTKLAELTLTVESLQRTDHTLDAQEDYGEARAIAYWTPRAHAKTRKRLIEVDEFELGGEG
jgi:tRNA(Met) C34 N-acetyltransferase TmcA